MIFIGIDPAADGLAIAAITDTPKLQLIAVAAYGGPERGVDAIQALHLPTRLPAFWSALVTLTSASIDAVAVEDQEIVYSSKEGANPRDLLPVTRMAGAAIGYFAPFVKHIFNPTGSAWKGQLPKRVNQGRTYTELGIQFETTTNKNPNDRYCVPLNFPFTIIGNANKADWRDIGDAAGLALHARKQWIERGRRSGLSPLVAAAVIGAMTGFVMPTQ